MSKEMTPKEALRELGDRLASVDTSKSIEEAHYDVFPIIKQALERAKKVEALLELYRECNKESVFWLEIQQRIAQLEKELEELK